MLIEYRFFFHKEIFIIFRVSNLGDILVIAFEKCQRHVPHLGELAISPPLPLHLIFGGGEAFAAVAGGELGVTEGARFLYGFHRFEAAPAQNFIQCAHHATSLVGEDIERPHRARCRDYHAAFTLVQGFWHGEAVLPHHAIHDAVEKQF